MKNTASADYSIIPAGKSHEKLLISQRRKMFDAFKAFREGKADDSVLHVGMARSPLIDSADYLLQWTEPQERGRITAHELELPVGGTLRQRTQNEASKRTQQQTGVHLPFADGEFDWVFGSEIIEHAGSFERQYALLKELARVSRKGVFVTTSNRWHPLEFNTGMPLLHWLPAPWWRRILKLSGKGPWASEAVLNLLDSRALYKLASLLPAKPTHDVGHKRIFGIKAHFFLMVQKNPAAEKAEKKDVEEMPKS